jgi:RNA polymerase sigma-70 factor (ECF subfamily)
LYVKRPKGTGGATSNGPVSAELVERCKRGDEAAWGELVEATYREVYTLCLRILENPDDAAEATQDAYLKVWRGLSGFRGEAQFSTWLYRVASNTAISKHRGRKRRRVHETGAEDSVLEQIPGSASVEDAAGARLEVAALEAALARVPEMYRDAVVLRDVYGYSIDEIASQLKISETAAKVRVHRGRKKLKELVYAGEDGSGEDG